MEKYSEEDLDNIDSELRLASKGDNIHTINKARCYFREKQSLIPEIKKALNTRNWKPLKERMKFLW